MIMAMKFASTAELKNRTNALLREVEAGRVVVITRRGKPVASVLPCAEDDIEDLVLETDPRIRRSIERAAADIAAGRGIRLGDYKRARRR
jgi:prevent-host-death family protein